MAKRVKVLAAKPNDLSSNPTTHRVSLSLTHTTYTLTAIKF